MRSAQPKLQSGEVDFEGLVSERGLTLGDIDLGDVTLEELSDAGETVFALSSGAVTAPEADLGAAIYQVNGERQETTFDEVKEDLKRGFSLDRAQRLIENEQTRLDDLLAAGATLEELANEATCAWKQPFIMTALKMTFLHMLHSVLPLGSRNRFSCNYQLATAVFLRAA